MILHISTHADYQPGSLYRPASLETEGFVHCSDFGTVHLPANQLFGGRTDLVLLVIDPGGLDVRWEPGVPPAPGGVWFPHVYGGIPAGAVVGVHSFLPGPEGFVLPEGLRGW